MKRIFFAGALTLIGFALHAQKAQFGLKGGANFNTLKYETHEENQMKAGFHVGGLVHIHVSKNFAIQPELVYSLQGSEFDNANGESQITLSYINMPVLLQYMAGSGFRVQTGPQVGFLVDAESEVYDDNEIEVDDSFKSTDFSWAFGAGYQFPSGFGIDARYNLGLSNINDATSVEVKNRVFQVGLFYQFKK